MAKRKVRVPAGYMGAEDVTPSLRAALDCDHRIVADIRARFERYGSISPKQAALVRKLASEDGARKADFAARAAKLAAGGVTVPVGAATIEGTVVVVKWKDGAFPGYKWLVESDAGWRVWGTVPAALRDDADEPRITKGDRVRFRATVKRSDDAAFGFASRPSQAVALPTPARAVASLVAALGAFSVAFEARRMRDESAKVAAVSGAVAAMGRYWARGALAVSGAVATMGSWYSELYTYRCGSCDGGWIRHFSTEYPCPYCAAKGKRLQAWKAKLALRQVRGRFGLPVERDRYYTGTLADARRAS